VGDVKAAVLVCPRCQAINQKSIDRNGALTVEG
jgi:phage FluMu protein Com